MATKAQLVSLLGKVSIDDFETEEIVKIKELQSLLKSKMEPPKPRAARGSKQVTEKKPFTIHTEKESVSTASKKEEVAADKKAEEAPVQAGTGDDNPFA